MVGAWLASGLTWQPVAPPGDPVGCNFGVGWGHKLCRVASTWPTGDLAQGSRAHEWPGQDDTPATGLPCMVLSAQVNPNSPEAQVPDGGGPTLPTLHEGPAADPSAAVPRLPLRAEPRGPTHVTLSTESRGFLGSQCLMSRFLFVAMNKYPADDNFN